MNHRHLLRALLITFAVLVVCLPAVAQDTTGMIAHVLQDAFFNTTGLQLIDTEGTLIADIPLDETEPQNYRATCDSPPQWSPDGTHLAFVRETADRQDDVRHLMVYEVETGEVRVLSENFYRTYDWSPDSQFIVHDTPIVRDDSGQVVDPQGLYRVNIETGEDEPMIPALDGAPLWRPDWSSDGARVAFHAPQQMEGLGEFVLADVDGANTAVWTEPIVGAFDWSPDGTQIAFDSVTYIPVSSQLAVADIDDANMAQNVEVIVTEGVPTEPQWSPDGNLIAFKQTDPNELRSSLWIVEADGSNPQQIAPEDVRSFSWSPDSTALVINTEQNIQIISLDGDEPQTIAAGACPVWRPESS